MPNVPKTLHLDADAYPICASNRNVEDPEVWRYQHISHLQAIFAHFKKSCAINSLKWLDDDAIREGCKGRPSGKRCCDPQWEPYEPAISLFFGGRWPEALDRAMHIPLGNYVRCLREIMENINTTNDEEVVDQAIKLWNEDYSFRKDIEPRIEGQESTVSEVSLPLPRRRLGDSECPDARTVPSPGAPENPHPPSATVPTRSFVRELVADNDLTSSLHTKSTQLKMTSVTSKKTKLFKICNISKRGTPLCADCRISGSSQTAWLVRHLDHAKAQPEAKDHIDAIERLKNDLLNGGVLDTTKYTGGYGKSACPAWSINDTRAESLFGPCKPGAFQQALHRATHVPWDTFRNLLVHFQTKRKAGGLQGVSKDKLWQPSDVDKAVEAWEQPQVVTDGILRAHFSPSSPQVVDLTAASEESSDAASQGVASPAATVRCDGGSEQQRTEKRDLSQGGVSGANRGIIHQDAVDPSASLNAAFGSTTTPTPAAAEAHASSSAANKGGGVAQSLTPYDYSCQINASPMELGEQSGVEVDDREIGHTATESQLPNKRRRKTSSPTQESPHSGRHSTSNPSTRKTWAEPIRRLPTSYDRIANDYKALRTRVNATATTSQLITLGADLGTRLDRATNAQARQLEDLQQKIDRLSSQQPEIGELGYLELYCPAPSNMAQPLYATLLISAANFYIGQLGYPLNGVGEDDAALKLTLARFPEAKPKHVTVALRHMHIITYKKPFGC